MRLLKKSAIIAYLEDNGGHCHWYDYYPLAWNIKVNRIDTMGRGYGNPYKNDPKYDDRWEAWLEKHDGEVFEIVCEDALSGLVGKEKQRMFDFFEGHPDPYLDGIHFEMWQAGRSGGWLVLDKIELPWPGIRFGRYMLNEYSFFRTHPDWNEFGYFALWVLYKFCREIDAYVEKKDEIVSDGYAQHRYDKEEEWREEDRQAEAALKAPVGPMFATV